jgi:hypothetical protein
MKTIFELLIRLHDMRCCCERVRRNPQLTNGEKAAACLHKQLVRECLPAVVLTHYDRMKETERALVACPEVFAMAVLVSTYRNLSPAQRRTLVAHFATPAPITSSAVQRNGTAKRSRSTVRRFNAGVGNPWPR